MGADIYHMTTRTLRISSLKISPCEAIQIAECFGRMSQHQPCEYQITGAWQLFMEYTQLMKQYGKRDFNMTFRQGYPRHHQ